MRLALLAAILALALGGCASKPPTNASGLELPPMRYSQPPTNTPAQ